MAHTFRQFAFRRLSLIVLAWPLLGNPQENPGQPIESESVPEAGSGLSIYETLVFDTPVALISGGEGRNETDRFHDIADLQVDEAHLEQQMMSVQDLTSAIDSIELTGGPWDLALAENLTAVADIYREQGAYEEAVDAYTRAIHVSRINLGLNSLDHVPAVERLVDTYTAMGDWDDADQYQEYLYYTQRRAFGLEDPRMVPVLERLAHWKLSVFNARWGDQLALNLVSALRLYQMASHIVGTNYGSEDERFTKYLRDTAGTAYMVAQYQSLLEETPTPEFRMVQERYPSKAGRYGPAFIEGYDEGLEALQLIVDSLAQSQPDSVEYATAQIHLADWYLLFGRYRTAEGHYGEAYQVLASKENSEELIAKAFGVVTPLPNFSDEIETIFVQSNVSEREHIARGSGYVDVKFDVTAYGSVTGLEVLTEDSEVDGRVLSSLRRKVRATTFRPLVKDGETVRSENNRFRYRFAY